MKPLFHPPALSEQKPSFSEIPPSFAAKLADFLGGAVADAQAARGGFSAAAGFIVTLADGRKFFLKGTHPGEMSHGAENLRQEIHAYETLPVLKEIAPRYLGLVSEGDDDGWMLGAWEYVAAAGAPAPEDCLRLLARFQKETRTAELRSARAHPFIRLFLVDEKKWRRIADEPQTAAKFDALFDDRDAAARWREKNLPRLTKLQGNLSAAGFATGLLHGDLRSDNFLQGAEKTFVIDWANACRGPLLFDALFLGAWLEGTGHGFCEQHVRATLEAPAADHAALLAGMSGYFADQAYRDPPAKMPRLRYMQKTMLAALMRSGARLGIIDSPPLFAGQIL